jgi:hypothetical protein
VIVPAGLTPAEAEAFNAILEVVAGLLLRARRMVSQGVTPITAADETLRAAGPRAVAAVAILGLWMALAHETDEGGRPAVN